MVEFTAVDYEGVEVTCTSEQWVLKVDKGRPELRGRRQEMIEAIERPDIVLQDRDFPGRRHYVRRIERGLYLKVVVAYGYDPELDKPVGFLLTVFICGRLREGDEVPYGERLRR